MHSSEDAVPIVEPHLVKVASAVPRRLLEALELKNDPEPGVPLPAELGLPTTLIFMSSPR